MTVNRLKDKLGTRKVPTAEVMLEGDVGLVRATPDGFQVVSSFKVTKGKGKFWAHPSISDGRLYLRHGEYLMVYNFDLEMKHRSRPVWRSRKSAAALSGILQQTLEENGP